MCCNQTEGINWISDFHNKQKTGTLTRDCIKVIKLTRTIIIQSTPTVQYCRNVEINTICAHKNNSKDLVLTNILN